MRGPVQINVVTPANNYNLVDLVTLKILLGIGNTDTDAYFNLVIPQASADIANYCNQPIVVETIQASYWPTRDGWPWVVRGELAPLQLPRWPLLSVASVVETIAGVPTTLLAGIDYIADMETGQLTRLGHNGYPRNWHANPIVVVFDAGYAIVPPDIVGVVVDIIKGKLAARARDPMLRSENIAGVYEAAYWFGAGPGSDGGMPSTLTGPLSRYRMPVIA